MAMAFTLKGEMIETCSCNMLCPCWYGVKELMIMDQGWCATTILFRIEEGSVDGVDLGGLNAAVGLFFPGPTMFDADGTGRLYVDDRISPEQEAALESIVQAKIGGPMEVPCSLLSSWLPTTRARIDVTAQNGNVHATVDGFGEISSKRLVNDLGDRMTMQNTGFVLAFQYENNTAELAPSDGTVWRDPDMPEVWDNKSGAVGQINWQVA
ncbi:MAG: DUF1326 domain-containing protein [Gammaproteobacteria bacterium]